jgi:hypothetical protein
MRQVRFEVFAQTPERPLLRFYGADGRWVGTPRELDARAVETFVAETESAYTGVSPDLLALGRRLYAWLDGTTERWLASAREAGPEAGRKKVVCPPELLSVRELLVPRLADAAPPLRASLGQLYRQVEHVVELFPPVEGGAEPLHALAVLGLAVGVEDHGHVEAKSLTRCQFWRPRPSKRGEVEATGLST